MVTYRKTKQGEWVAFGPTSEVSAECSVCVTKKSGERKTEFVVRVGRTFDVKGVPHCYGYLQRGSGSPRSYRRSAKDWPGKECPRCGSEPLNGDLYCWECGYQGSR